MENSINIKHSTKYSGLTKLNGSIKAWIVVLGLMLLVKLILIGFFPKAFADPSQASFFKWENLIVIWLMGLLGVWLSRRTGFPEALTQNVSNWIRYGLPGLLGLLAGIIFVAVDTQTDFTKIALAQQNLTQQYSGFVPMLLIFVVASIIVEVVYRLMLVPLLLWFISNLLMRRRHQDTTFWVLAVLTSLIEPLTQLPVSLAVAPGVMIFLLVTQFGINLAQAAFFRKYGFIAAIMLRVGFYLVFHVLYIH